MAAKAILTRSSQLVDQFCPKTVDVSRRPQKNSEKFSEFFWEIQKNSEFFIMKNSEIFQ